MAQANPSHLIWVDMEMSGLFPEEDTILEIAMVITDDQLHTIAEAPVFILHQPESILASMDAWNQSMHTRSGLIEKVRASTLSPALAEIQIVDFLAQWVKPQTSPMCGNSICQDRRFMARWLPKLEAFFHYRNLDVSTLKELMNRWRPDLKSGLVKHGKHEALADIYESINELSYYREHFLRCENSQESIS